MDSKETTRYFNALAIFTLKKNRFYRVCVGAKELLFLEAGPGQGQHVVAHSAIHGGVLGALIGWLIARSMRQKTEKRTQRLDGAAWDELVKLTEEEKHSFRAAYSEISDASVDPPAFFGRQNCVAMLTLNHCDRGKLKLDLSTLDDARTAIEALSEPLGESLTINVAWDERKKRFVRP